IDIATILFLDLISCLHPTIGKLEQKTNICYTTYLSLIMEHLLKDACKQADLISLKPFHTTTIIFKTSYGNETALTSHMCKLVTQSKAPTIKKLRKKKISSLTKPEALQSSRIDSSSTQATHLQYTEEFVVPVDSNKCLEASKLEEEQGNQPNTVDVEKVTIFKYKGKVL
ncbi:hypothetical protein Tco_1117940, partial [Tanacetum coccineum]